MIYIGLGANLPSEYGSPLDTLKAAKDALKKQDIDIVAQSGTWLSAPVPFDAEQDWFHNEIIGVRTSVSAHDLLGVMLHIETEFGRVRSVKNAPRLLDLDLIAYDDDVIKDGERLIIPHPRMHERLFVLKPMAELDPNWVHPVSHDTLSKMILDIGSEQEIKRL